MLLVVDEVRGSRIELKTIPQIQTPILCFKSNGPSANNLIIQRIRANHKTNPTYWNWGQTKPTTKQTTAKPTHGQTAPKKVGNKKRTNSASSSSSAPTGLEALVRELNMDPSALDMRGAYEAITRNYYLIKRSDLSITGQLNAEDKAFLLKQLSCYFSKELAYVPKPFQTSTGMKRKTTSVSKTMAALATINGGSTGDYAFIQSEAEDKELTRSDETEVSLRMSTKPNDSISKCFRQLISTWIKTPGTSETAEITTNDLVCMLNGGSLSQGAYRSTSVRGLIRPFIEDGLITIKDDSQYPPRYIVNVKGMISKLDSISTP